MTAYKFTPLTVGTIEVIFWKTVALEIERSHLKVFCEIAYGKSQAIRQMFVKFQLYIYDGVFFILSECGRGYFYTLLVFS